MRLHWDMQECTAALLHAKKAAGQYGLDAREILIEIGKRKAVGGQEDQILDAARMLAGC